MYIPQPQAPASIHHRQSTFTVTYYTRPSAMVTNSVLSMCSAAHRLMASRHSINQTFPSLGLSTYQQRKTYHHGACISPS